MLASSVAGAWEGVWVGLAEGRCSEKNELFDRLRAAPKRQVQLPSDGRKKTERERLHALLVEALTFTCVQRSLF